MADTISQNPIILLTETYYIGVYISNYKKTYYIQSQIQFIQTAMRFCVFMMCSY